MTREEFIIGKLNYLAQQTPTPQTHQYVQSWLQQWAENGKWWYRWFGLIKPSQRIVYETALLTLARWNYAPAEVDLNKFYQPSSTLSDRQAIERSVILFFKARYFGEAWSKLDFANSADKIYWREQTDKSAYIIYTLGPDATETSFLVTLQKKANGWVVSNKQSI